MIFPTKSQYATDKDLIEALYQYIHERNEEIEKLEAEVARLKDFEWMYEDLVNK